MFNKLIKQSDQLLNKLLIDCSRNYSGKSDQLLKNYSISLTNAQQITQAVWPTTEQTTQELLLTLNNLLLEFDQQLNKLLKMFEQVLKNNASCSANYSTNYSSSLTRIPIQQNRSRSNCSSLLTLLHCWHRHFCQIFQNHFICQGTWHFWSSRGPFSRRLIQWYLHLK